jgi:type I site-specific restriction endonuclease
MVAELIRAEKQLFSFQQTCLDNVNQAISEGSRSLALISLMGSGKTVMAAALIKQYVNEGKRVLFLVDLTVLINQISDELTEWGITHTILQSNRKLNTN